MGVIACAEAMLELGEHDDDEHVVSCMLFMECERFFRRWLICDDDESLDSQFKSVLLLLVLFELLILLPLMLVVEFLLQ